jgi:hypothetical protein|tara:strand:+ start:158 stop:277 length:120 start_codon:yes stop_codon:yes gene_type:complete
MLEVWFGLSLAFLISLAAVCIGILVAEETDINRKGDDYE